MEKTELLQQLGVQGTKKSDPTLEKTEKALEKLGKPQQDYEVILVGGTNGKGSTVEMVSELLQGRGYKVGVNKSPHLTSPTERVKVNSEEIKEEKMKEMAETIIEEKPDLSFFELMTVMAYKYFSEKSVDFAVVEVGMGGRLDATNAAENSTAVVTNIGLDHTKYLGERKEEIAEEKSAIIPKNQDLIAGSDLQPLKDAAKRKNAKIHRPREIKDNGETLSYRGQQFRIPVRGDYQIKNLETALRTIEVVDQVPEDLELALENLECPGRMEKISESPEVILDGAHNLQAVKEIMKEIEPGFTCIFNCTKTKNAEKMIREIEENAEKIIFTESEIEWSEDAEKLERECKIDSSAEKELQKALEKAKNTAGETGRVLVTGSLYLIGDIKSSLS